MKDMKDQWIPNFEVRSSYDILVENLHYILSLQRLYKIFDLLILLLEIIFNISYCLIFSEFFEISPYIVILMTIRPIFDF